MRRADILFCMLMAALLFSACAGPSGGTEVGNPDPNTDTAQPQTFRSKAYGVDITYPYGLQVVEVGQAEVRFGTEAVAYFVESEDPASDLALLAGQSKPGQTATAYDAPGFDQGYTVVNALSGRTLLYLAADTFLVILESSSMDSFSVSKEETSPQAPPQETSSITAEAVEASVSNSDVDAKTGMAADAGHIFCPACHSGN